MTAKTKKQAKLADIKDKMKTIFTHGLSKYANSSAQISGRQQIQIVWMETECPYRSSKAIYFANAFHDTRVNETNATIRMGHCGDAMVICVGHVRRTRTFVDAWYRLQRKSVLLVSNKR